MRIVVTGSGESARLRVVHPNDLGAFSVVSSTPAPVVAETLAVLGDGGAAAIEGHVTMLVSAVRRLVAGQVDDGWEERFIGMLAYAKKKGWMTSDGSGILAHVVDDLAAQTPEIVLNSGRAIPQLGYGVFRVPPGETERLVTEALEVGYRHIDTAAMYGNEAEVGRAMRASGIPREELFVTTKLANDQQGEGKARAAFEKSLEALGLDFIDLYLIHWPAPNFDLYVETWSELEHLRGEGLAASIGVSNFLPQHLERLLARAETVPAVNQIERHPILQQRAAVDFSRRHGIAVEAWSPLGAGQLPLLVSAAVQDAAAILHRTPAQILLRWHIQHGTIVIPKSSSRDRMRENAQIFDFTLDDTQMAAIDALERGGRVGFHPDEWH